MKRTYRGAVFNVGQRISRTEYNKPTHGAVTCTHGTVLKVLKGGSIIDCAMDDGTNLRMHASNFKHA